MNRYYVTAPTFEPLDMIKTIATNKMLAHLRGMTITLVCYKASYKVVIKVTYTVAKGASAEFPQKCLNTSCNFNFMI